MGFPASCSQFRPPTKAASHASVAMPGLASPGRVSALAVDCWSLKKSKLAFQRTPQDLEENLKMAKVNQIKKNFLNNYKIGSGLKEEMLLARSKEVGG